MSYDIQSMDHGDEFLDAYVLVNNAFLTYFGTKAVVQVVAALPKLAAIFNTFKSSDDYAKLKTTNPSKAGEIEQEVNEILEKGDDIIKDGTNVFKIIITDVRKALQDRISHIRSIVFEQKSNGTYRFSGCHSKSAIDELGLNARIEITTPPNGEGVYEAKVFAKGPDGKEIMKSGNGGKSTFFPDTWDEARILDEAEHAVRNNRGFIDPTDASKGYYGFSKDGKIKIGFYCRDADGYIGSFFPILTP